MKASRIGKLVGYDGGREGWLSNLGRVLRWIGIAVFVLSVIAIVSHSGKDAVSLVILAFGIVGFLQGIIADVFCQGFAEVVRLLKKQNGLPYGGEILPPTPVYLESCSACGFEAESLQLPPVCAKCGANFDSDSE